MPTCRWATLWARLLTLPADLLGVDGMLGEAGETVEGEDGVTDDDGRDEPQPT